MRRLRGVAAALLLAACTINRPTLADTAALGALGALGDLRLGMTRGEAMRIANEQAMRTERVSCRSRPGYEYCTTARLSADSERNLGLLFQGDTLRALSWTRSEDFASLRRRYTGFGDPRWARVGRSPRPADIIATWVGADSTVAREALCHEGRSRPVCKIVAASTTPAQVRVRAASAR